MPMELPNLTRELASAVAERAGLSPEARALLASNADDPSAFIEGLAARGMNDDAVASLAHGMSERRGVQWAAASARKVEAKLPPAELEALGVTETWVTDGAPDATLARVIDQAGPAGPGSWAAQAARWSAQSAKLPASAGVPAAPLSPKAVEGAVRLAAAVEAGSLQLPASLPTFDAASLTSALARPELAQAAAPVLPAQLAPAQLTAMNDALAPFVKLGMQIASGAPV